MGLLKINVPEDWARSGKNVEILLSGFGDLDMSKFVGFPSEAAAFKRQMLEICEFTGAELTVKHTEAAVSHAKVESK